MHRQPTLAALAALALAACGTASSVDEADSEWFDVASTEQAAGVACHGSDPCSGEGTVYAATYRVGVSATSRGEYVQTFLATSAGTPAKAHLVLRSMRPFTQSTAELQVEIRGPVAASGALTLPATSLVSGSTTVVADTRGEVSVALSGTGSLTAGQHYALVVRVDGTVAGGETVLFGLGSLSTVAYENGAAFLMTQRRENDTSAWGLVRPRSASAADLSFAFSGGVGSPCAGAGDCRSDLTCLTGTCTAQRAASCTGLPGNASWNTASTITQTWSGSAWAPSTQGTHDLTASTTECRFKCNGAYVWSGVACVLDTMTPRASCQAHFDAGLRTNGVHRLDTDGAGPLPAFDAFCDQENDGGGWTMCYTTDATVHISSDAPGGTYGVNGYRSNCRDLPFRDVRYVNHSSGNTSAWFRRDIAGTVVASTNYGAGGSAYGLWTSMKTATTGYKYQLNVCDNLWMEVGFMISGYTSCWKQCGSWCSDTGTVYFRVDGDNGGNYNGVAFNENGHTNVSTKLMSVGIR